MTSAYPASTFFCGETVNIPTPFTSTSSPLRVLLILEAALGGTGRHVLDLTEGLLRRRHEVHLIYSPLRSDLGFQNGLAVLRNEHPRFRAQSTLMTREVTARDVVAYWNLLRYVRSHGPFDVIHSHSTKAGFLGRLLVGVGGAAKIYTPNALMTMDPALRGVKRKAVSLMEACLALLSRAVVVVSAEEFECAQRTGIPKSKLVSIPNGIRLSEVERHHPWRARQRRILGLEHDDICVGFVGRLGEQKAPHRALEAFALLRTKTNRHVKLAIVGYGPLESAMKEASARLGLTTEVIWVGQGDGVAFMPAFDVLVNCSRYEGFSYVMIEALAAGLPIVTTRVGGVAELIAAGGTCFVCDPWNSEKFSRRLFEAVEDVAVGRFCSETSRKASRRFDVETMVAAVCELYAPVAGSPIPPQPRLV